MSVLASQLRAAGAFVPEGIRDHERVAYGTRTVAPEPVIQLTLSELAKILGLPEHDIRALEPEDFAVPHDWRYLGGQTVYTAAGLTRLVEELHDNGHLEASITLKLTLAELQRPPPRGRRWWEEKR